MTKTEIAEQMAQDAGISKAVAETALRSCIDSITKSSKNGQEVTIVGFGDLQRGEPSRPDRPQSADRGTYQNRGVSGSTLQAGKSPGGRGKLLKGSQARFGQGAMRSASPLASS